MLEVMLVKARLCNGKDQDINTQYERKGIPKRAHACKSGR